MPDKDIHKINFIERMLFLFVSPADLMKNIKLNPVVLLPLLICVLLSIAQLPLTTRYSEIQTRSMSIASLERYGVDYFNFFSASDDDMDALEGDIALITQISTIGGALVAYPLSAFFAALGLFLLTKAARGKELQFKQYYSMYIHLFIISTIGSALTCFLCVSLDNPLDFTSLAAVFMPMGDISMPVFNILSSVTVFNIWITVLAIIGIRHINSFSYTKSIIIGLTSFIVSVGFSALSLSLTFSMLDIINNISFI